MLIKKFQLLISYICRCHPTATLGTSIYAFAVSVTYPPGVPYEVNKRQVWDKGVIQFRPNMIWIMIDHTIKPKGEASIIAITSRVVLTIIFFL